MEQYHFLVNFVTANFEHFFNALRIGKCDKAKTTKRKMVNKCIFRAVGAAAAALLFLFYPFLCTHNKRVLKFL